jgi:putative oxidoreductase
MEIGLLLLRLAVGLTLAAHGSQKLFGWFGGYGLDGTGQFMEGLGFRPGRLHALMAGLAEAGGLLLAFGFLTPLGSALVASVMIVAVMTVHLKNGFWLTGNGYEYNLLIGIAALSLAFTGPGTLSIDALLGLSFGGAAWGIAALVMAVLGAAVQLAQRRVPRATQETKTA